MEPVPESDELLHFRQQWKEEVLRSSSSSQPATAIPSSSRPRNTAFSRLHKTNLVPDTVPLDEAETDFAIPRVIDKHEADQSLKLARKLDYGEAESALEHYEQAVEKETEGNLGESVKLYRRAYRLDHTVDKSYREKHFPRKLQHPKAPESAPSTSSGTHEAFQARLEKPIGVSEAIASFAGLKIEPLRLEVLETEDAREIEQQKERVYSPLSAIPHELLLHILYELAMSDVATFARSSSVCKSFAYLVATEQQIWRALCASVYSQMAWDWTCTVKGTPIFREVLEPSYREEHIEASSDELLQHKTENDGEDMRTVPVDEEVITRYSGNWQAMYRLRARIRFNGIYISTCNYHRPGGASTTSISWSTPVHIVTYYRYIRFFPDGTLLSLLSTCEPSDVVYSFSKPYVSSSSHLVEWGRYVSHGRWRLDVDGRVDIEIEPEGIDRYVFRMQLRCQKVRARGTGGAGEKGHQWMQGNKLAWEGFWSWNKVTEDLGVFEGRNDKPFYFSRVAVVEQEMGYS